MDLSRFDTRAKAEAGVDVPLVLGGETVMGDDGEPVTFRLRGPTDDRVADAVLKVSDKPARTAKDVRANDIRVLRVAVAGWSDNFVFQGEKPTFSVEAIEAIAQVPAIRRALVSEVLNEANFTVMP